MKYLSVILCLFISTFCFTQQEDFKFDHITIRDGLAHNSILSLLQDRFGYLWIGTQNGLNKFDGIDFKLYKSNTDSQNQSYFKGKHILSLFEDAEGNLWVGTENNGLNVKWNTTDVFANIPLDSLVRDIGTPDITAINQDSQGYLWICTNGQGVLKYHPRNQSIKQYSSVNGGLSNDSAFDMIEDKTGRIWIATAGRGLNVLEGKSFKSAFMSIPNNPSMDGYRKKLLLDEHVLYVSSEGTGLYEIDLETNFFKHYSTDTEGQKLSSYLVRDILLDEYGNILLATDGGGLNIIDKQTKEISQYSFASDDPNSLNSNALICLLKDETDHIWIGTYNGGVNKIRKSKNWFKHYKPTKEKSQGEVFPSVLGLVQTKEGSIFIGTDGGGLSKLNTSKHTFNNYSSSLNGGAVIKSLFEDKAQNLWIGTYGSGLIKYDPKTGNAENFLQDPLNDRSISENNIWAITQRKNGDLWVGTTGSGINVLANGNDDFASLRHDPSDKQSLIDNKITCLFSDSKDRVWIGTKSQGLDLWENGAIGFRHFQHLKSDSNSISNNEINSIFEDSKGNIWIATEGGGLNRFTEEGKFIHFKKKDGLLSNEIIGIIEDNYGMLWLANYEGLSRFNPVDNTSKHFIFDESEFGTQFNQVAVLNGNDGILYFGGISGVYSIDPTKIKEKEQPSNLIFTSFEIFNQEVKQGIEYNDIVCLREPIEQAKEIHLDFTQNSFALSFMSIDPAQNFPNENRYTLEGFDKEWVTSLAPKAHVNYTNLDPGEYRFISKNNQEEIKLDIIIGAPFWMKTWFKVLLGWLVFLGIIFINTYSNKVNEEKHRQELKEAESRILQLKNKNLEIELESQNSKLLFSTAQMAHKNEILTAMKEELQNKQKESGVNLGSIVRGLDRELQGEDYWKEFNMSFQQVDGNFVNQIMQKHPQLTKNDIRLSALIRIGLSTNEIASILNISIRGVEKGRYRLKKRLQLSQEENLINYIVHFQG